MKPPFPSREELKQCGYEVETLNQYDRWREAYDEAMDLAAQLPEVFGSPPRPMITLHVARGYDDEWNLSAARVTELAALDPEQDWRDVSGEAITTFQEYFIFSDAEGWRFYLPAFLHHYLSEFPLSGWNAVYRACVRRDHFDLLTECQVAFIERFLDLCHRHASPLS